MSNLVFVEKNQAVTDSLTISHVFNKEHRRVMQDIRELGCSKEFRQHNFVQSSYLNSQNKEMPKYYMNKKGFTLLVMGYTGKEAMKFKEAYIEEFEKMEEKLKSILTPSYMIDDPIQRAEKWIEERKQYQAIETKAAVLEQRVAEYEPKISYLDTILNTKDTVTISQIADDYGMSGQKFNKLLHEIGIQYKLNGQWLLYSKFKGEGYTKSQTLDVTKSDGQTKVVMNTRWTQKGRLFLYEKLKAYDVLPLMDQELDKKLRLAK